MICILCHSSLLEQIKFSENLKERIYFQCLTCDLIFLNPKERLVPAEEKARYEKHENNVLDKGYQNFVSLLKNEIVKSYDQNSVGLDYGSGKESAIGYLLSEEKFTVQRYDPFFVPDVSFLKKNFYDYIIVCEVAEHFYAPGLEFAKLKEILKPKGQIFIQTSLVSKNRDFKNWSYRRDSTHVCFYSKLTFRWIKKKYLFSDANILSENLVVLIL